MNSPVKLGNDTWIPLGAAVLIFGAAMWLTSVWAQGVSNSAAIVDIKTAQDKSDEKIYHELEKINTKLDRLQDKK